MEMREHAEKFDHNMQNQSLDGSYFSLGGAALPSSGSAGIRKRPYMAPSDNFVSSNGEKQDKHHRSESQENRSSSVYLPKSPVFVPRSSSNNRKSGPHILFASNSIEYNNEPRHRSIYE